MQVAPQDDISSSRAASLELWLHVGALHPLEHRKPLWGVCRHRLCVGIAIHSLSLQMSTFLKGIGSGDLPLLFSHISPGELSSPTWQKVDLPLRHSDSDQGNCLQGVKRAGAKERARSKYYRSGELPLKNICIVRAVSYILHKYSN